MYCKNCGAKLEDGQKFCSKCGTPVDTPQAPGASASGRQNQQQAGQQTQQQQQQQYQYQGAYSQEIPGRSEAIGSMVLGIVAIVFWWFGWSALASIVLAIVGLVLASNAKKKGYTGGIQTAGFVLCIVSLFGGILIFIACVACTGLGIASLSLTY